MVTKRLTPAAQGPKASFGLFLVSEIRNLDLTQSCVSHQFTHCHIALYDGRLRYYKAEEFVSQELLDRTRIALDSLFIVKVSA